MYPSGSHSPRILPTKPLKRGKACLTCRFLKIKCDGARPICGPCQRHPKDDPCEYADGPGRSRTKQLEEMVSRLEARLREYENPNETPAVTLSNPYDGSETESTLRVNLPPQPSTRYSSELSTYSPSSPQYSTASPASSSSTPRSSVAPPNIRRTSESPPSDNDLAIRNLLDAFFTHASSFGFFLNVSRFYNAALQPSSFTFPTRPCSALLNTVLLCGLHLSPPGFASSSPIRGSYSPNRTAPQTQKQEYEYLIRALRDTAIELCSVSHAGTNQYHVQHSLLLQIVQAEVLLSYYFFHTANITEARRHASSAASLVLGSSFHRIWSTSTASPLSASGPQASRSPGGPRSDAIEEGERINGFWAVFVLYRNLAVAVDAPSEVCGVFDAPGMQVDTPWPLDMETYKEGILPDPGSSTVWNYLNHVQSRIDSPYSTNTLLAKASILLHQATFLEGQYHPAMSARDSQSFSAAFQSLNHLIESLGTQLPPLSRQASQSPIVPTNPSSRLLFLAHSMLHGATIKLHGLFAYSDPSSRQMCVAAARAMIVAGGINVQDFGCVNPIMGTLWILASQILTEELSRLRSIHQSSSSTYHTPSTSAEESEQEILTLLQVVLGAMSYFSTNSAMMSKCSLAVRRWIPGNDDDSTTTTTATTATTARSTPSRTTTTTTYPRSGAWPYPKPSTNKRVASRSHGRTLSSYGSSSHQSDPHWPHGHETGTRFPEPTPDNNDPFLSSPSTETTPESKVGKQEYPDYDYRLHQSQVCSGLVGYPADSSWT